MKKIEGNGHRWRDRASIYYSLQLKNEIKSFFSHFRWKKIPRNTKKSGDNHKVIEQVFFLLPRFTFIRLLAVFRMDFFRFRLNSEGKKVTWNRSELLPLPFFSFVCLFFLSEATHAANNNAVNEKAYCFIPPADWWAIPSRSLRFFRRAPESRERLRREHVTIGPSIRVVGVIIIFTYCSRRSLPLAATRAAAGPCGRRFFLSANRNYIICCRRL